MEGGTRTDFPFSKTTALTGYRQRGGRGASERASWARRLARPPIPPFLGNGPAPNPLPGSVIGSSWHLVHAHSFGRWHASLILVSSLGRKPPQPLERRWRSRWPCAQLIKSPPSSPGRLGCWGRKCVCRGRMTSIWGPAEPREISSFRVPATACEAPRASGTGHRPVPPPPRGLELPGPLESQTHSPRGQWETRAFLKRWGSGHISLWSCLGHLWPALSSGLRRTD